MTSRFYLILCASRRLSGFSLLFSGRPAEVLQPAESEIEEGSFVSGHGFSPAANAANRNIGFSRCGQSDAQRLKPDFLECSVRHV
jgi:hypothetical protein